jgi:hypothetical protein
MSKQCRLEQLQLSVLLERFPYYVMVLDAEDLTIQAVNPAYKHLLGNRNVFNLPLSEVFGGRQVDELLKVLTLAVRDAQSHTTGPIQASVDSAHNDSRYVHTVVPISDANGSSITRLFIYSEKTE